MKITVVSMTDPRDSRTWSGTTKNIVSALEKIADVDTITLESKMTLLIKKWTLRYLKHIKKQEAANFETTVIGAKYWSHRLDKLIFKQKEKSDFYIIPGGASIISYSKNNRKMIDVADATYKLMENYYYKENGNRIIGSEGNLIDKLALDKSYKIIVSSMWARNSVIEDYSEPEKKVMDIPFGVNLPAETVTPKQIINKKVINLLLVGVEWERKGVGKAIETVKILNKKDSYHCYKLNIVGVDKPPRFEEKNIKILGKLNKNNVSELEKLQQEYSKADIFILPTKAEAAGIANAEAEMYGLPVFTSDTGGVSDYVINGKTGYTFSVSAGANEYSRKIIELVNNPEEYSKISEQAIKHYQNKLNWERWAEKVIEFLKE